MDLLVHLPRSCLQFVVRGRSVDYFHLAKLDMQPIVHILSEPSQCSFRGNLLLEIMNTIVTLKIHVYAMMLQPLQAIHVAFGATPLKYCDLTYVLLELIKVQ